MLPPHKIENMFGRPTPHPHPLWSLRPYLHVRHSPSSSGCDQCVL